MTNQDSTLKVAPLTPALKRRETRVSGLTERTCKFSFDKLCLLCSCLIFYLFNYLSQGMDVASTMEWAIRWVR